MAGYWHYEVWRRGERNRWHLPAFHENRYAPVAAIVETAAERGTPLDRLESDWLGIQHAEVGSRLMEHWRLPMSIVKAIRWHHAAPECLLERRSEVHFPMQAAMALAACAGDFVCSTAREPARERLHRLACDRRREFHTVG